MSEADLKQLVPSLFGSLQSLCAEVERARQVVENATAAAIESAEPYIGKNEAAKFLGFSSKTLERRMAEHDGPPRYIDGGKISFLRSELRVWRRQWRAGDQTGLEGQKSY